MPFKANEFQYDLGVGMTAKFAAARGKLGGNGLVIVNLAVIGDDESSVGGNHRLMPGGRKIDDRQSAMNKRGSGFGVDPDALVVRPAICKARGHPFGDGVDVAAGNLGCRADEACNAAHRYRSAQ